MTTNPFPFKVLFWFADDSKIIAEIKRTDIQSEDKNLVYSWLHIDTHSEQIKKLTFQSMNQLDGEQIRMFSEGILKWNTAYVTFDGKKMTRVEPEQLPLEALELIAGFLD